MKKLFLTTSLLVLALAAFCQTPFFGDKLFVSADKQDTMWIRFVGDTIFFKGDNGFFKFGKALMVDSIRLKDGKWYKSFDMLSAFNGNRTVTRAGVPAVNVGGSTLAEWLNNYFFPSTSPTATISVSGGILREYMSAGAALSVDLPWSVTRPVACAAISTITVDGISQTVNAIAEGQSQSGTLTTRALPRNTSTTYTVSVVTSDGKTGSASSTVAWQWKRYWGAFASAVPPTNAGFSITDAQILALTGAGVGTGNELSTTRVKTYNNINAAGNYLVFAWPSSWGTPTFVINGLINTAFTKVRSNTFVNASGGSTAYDVWVSNTTQASAIAQFQIN
jgi:hypothetical protein